MSKFFEAMKEYREPATGMVGGGKNPKDHSCDNGVLFSSAYMLILRRQTDMSVSEIGDEVKWYRELIQKCWYPGISGLLCRYPGHFGPQKEEQHDDYHGVIAVSRVYGLSLAQEILAYGEGTSFCWNTEDPARFDIHYEFDRFPGFTASLRAACSGSLSIGDQLEFFLSCMAIFTEAEGDTTGTILQWLSCLATEGRGWFSDLGISIWRSRAQKKWPGGIAQVFGVYFQNPDHPMATFGPKDFR